MNRPGLPVLPGEPQSNLAVWSFVIGLLIAAGLIALGKGLL